MKPLRNGTLLSRLIRDTGGNTLAIAAASTFAIMGVVGGAVDISRTYMVESRLQQACDAGALAARKAMSGETLTQANKDVGYKYFDFNYQNGDYSSEMVSRAYTQETNDAGTPQAVVNGTIVAHVPTTVMRIFGNETIDLTVTCSSKMDVANADVAMVLDVTDSMTMYTMKISASGTATETRLAAMQKAVKAFYDALGPGRAGGDLSKGRIRYAFVPYGTMVNVGHLLTHDQMVNSHTYQSRQAISSTQYGWAFSSGSSESSASYPSWPSTPTGTDLTEINNASNYGGFSDVSGSGSVSYTRLNGTSTSLAKSLTGTNDDNQTNCHANNNYSATGIASGNFKDIARTNGSESETSEEIAPVYVSSGNPNTRSKEWSKSRTNTVTAYRYRYYTSSPRCRLQSASGKTSNPNTRWTETVDKTTTRNITWTAYTGINYVYGPRTFDVSAIKGSGSTWNSTVSLPALTRSGTVIYYDNVKLSGDLTETDDVPSGGSIAAGSATWRGCIEERQMDNTITGATSVSTVPANAYDLNVNLLADSTDDATRWRPLLWQATYEPNASNPDPNSDECPAPALKLQEIGNYNSTILTSNYPNLFDAVSAANAADSYYYPYSSTLWSGTGTAAERSRNIQTIRNYIDRIGTTHGTLHDAGFIWGLHLVSGEGMFAAENPDRFNGMLVSRHIVFMTDGEMNPGEERYVFSGVNHLDGRMAPTSTSDAEAIVIENRRMRILCEAAKDQGITVWVVAITASDTTADSYNDLEECATSGGHYKTAATSNELVSSFTTIAQSIGGLRISE
jgi:Flp pilus assembly protein TadG